MFSDTLLLAERAHLNRILVWGAASVIVGTLLLAFVTARRVGSPLLLHFAVQTAAWGAIDLVIALVARRGLALRDVSGATRLDRFVWFNNGLDVGYVAVGLTLAIVGWQLGRRLGLVGAGVGIVVQGLALLVLDLRFSNTLARLL
jgi:hypothetical protein